MPRRSAVLSISLPESEIHQFLALHDRCRIVEYVSDSQVVRAALTYLARAPQKVLEQLINEHPAPRMGRPTTKRKYTDDEMRRAIEDAISQTKFR